MSLRRISALAVVGALLVSGCQDEPEPRFEDPTESPTASASESGDPPESQSAEEFVREWVRLHTEMQNTGDTKEFLAKSKGCDACIELAELVESYYADGGAIQTEGWKINSLSKRPGSTSQRAEFQAKVSSAVTRYTERAGAEEKVLPAGHGTELFVVQRVAGDWSMAKIAELAQ